MHVGRDPDINRMQDNLQTPMPARMAMDGAEKPIAHSRIAIIDS